MGDLVPFVDIPSPASCGIIIVETNSDCGQIRVGFIVASYARWSDKNLQLRDAKFKNTLELRTRNKELGVGYSQYCSSKGNVVSIDYAWEVPFVIIPKNIVSNVYAVQNFDSFPNTAKWATLTKEGAEEIAQKHLSEEEAKIIDINKKIFPLVEKDYIDCVLRIEGGKAWPKLSIIKQLFKYRCDKDRFVIDYMNSDWRRENVKKMMVPMLIKQLEEGGVNVDGFSHDAEKH